jgi:thioredoxin-dependent peroxiredoxin
VKKTLLFAFAATLIAAATLVTARADDAATIPAVGQAAPTFTLPSEDGSPISLSQYKGKWVVLYFYPKDMSQGCTIEAHNFQNALPQFDAKKAVIVGVSVDTSDSHKEFCAKDSLTFHLLADTDHKVTSMYGSAATRNGNVMAARNTFLIDPKGKIAKVWTGVSPATAASDVLAALP